MDPTRPTADTCHKNRKILERNYPRKKNEKFSEKKIKQKKIKETFSLVPLSLPSLNCKANFFLQEQK
jgi:hypothetical protein